MPEDLDKGAVTDSQPVEQNQSASNVLTLEQVQAMIKSERDATAKEWQSRFDKLLAEKKQESEKKLTVEERLAQMEAERIAERVDWARKEARAKAGIDTELEKAFGLYLSTDPESISMGADKVKDLWTAKEAAYKSRIEELEKSLKFGAQPAKGASSNGKGMESMSLDQLNEYALQGEAQLQEVLAYSKSRKK
jgi:hypothetical protein